MHNNYYFLKQLSAALKPKLREKVFATCFSQHKNELILGFVGKSRTQYVKAYLQPAFCCLSFPEEFNRARKNSVDLFQEAIGKSVIEIEQALNERAFKILLSDHYFLLFKMHGNRSNILLGKGDQIVSIFKKKFTNDLKINPASLDRPLNQSKEDFLEVSGQYQMLFPTFGKLLHDYLLENGYDSLRLDEKWDKIGKLLAELNNPKYYIINVKGKINFSLVHMAPFLEKWDDPMEAVTKFFQIYLRTSQLESEKSAVLKNLNREKIKTFNYLKKNESKLNKISKTGRYEELANIIMANLQNIPAHEEAVKLFDFYNNEEIIIPLKKTLSPQKNAEYYYRKAKNQKIELKNLQNNIQAKQNVLKAINEKILAISQIDEIRELKKFQPGIAGKNTTPAATPFKKFTRLGFEILVGKSASTNDELTSKYAKKDDLWLHAKDVSGSHVVIKHQSGKIFPKEVIETAAALAAFYSKRKNDTLCPVIYTPKKYVRKPKSAGPGKVIVEKEKIILIEPENRFQNDP